MVKVYINLPNETYKFVKNILRERKITFSEYYCELIDEEMKKLANDNSYNDELDQFICDEAGRGLKWN